jgi:hypothetical protein
MGSLVVVLSTLLQICCPGFSGSVLQVTEELDELPPKAMKGFPPPPPPEPAIDDDSENHEKSGHACALFVRVSIYVVVMQTYRTFALP